MNYIGGWKNVYVQSPITKQNFFEGVINKYDSHIDSIISDKMLSDNPKNENIKMDRFREMLRQLKIWMLRYYREEGLLDKWNNLYQDLEEDLDNFSEEDHARFYYEQVLCSLFQLDLAGVKQKLSEWNINGSLSFWEAKKAGLLAEIGEMEAAKNILTNSLTTIRNRLNLNPITTDYSLVSQESYVMFLLQYIQGGLMIQLHDREKERDKYNQLSEQFRERWNTLQQYKCDPWNEIDLMRIVLESSPREIPKKVTREKQFDIGAVKQTYNLSMIALDPEKLNAYRFLRFCEDIGAGLRIPGSNLGKRSITGVLIRISQSDSYWATVTILRFGDNEVVDHIFNRLSLYNINAATVDNLVEEYLRALRNSILDIQSGNHFTKDNFGILLAQIIPEILSRLCCKCSLDSKHNMLDFLIEIYLSDHRNKYAKVSSFTQRLLNSFSIQERFHLIPKLLEFPIHNDLNEIQEREFYNPILHINTDEEIVDDLSILIPNNKIEELISKASSDIKYERKWALITLIQLYKLNLLESRYKDRLADSLWSQVDQFGLPDNTHYHKFAFLDFPHPPSENPRELFAHYIRSTSLSFVNKGKDGHKSFSITGGTPPILHDIISADEYLEWSDEQIFDILDRLIVLWNTDKEYLVEEDQITGFPSITVELRNRFNSLIDTLVSIIHPQAYLDDNRKKMLELLIDDLQLRHFPILRLHSACIHIYPERTDKLFYDIESALFSDDLELIVDSMEAILILAERYKFDIEQDKLFHLLNILGQLIRWRKKDYLSTAFNIISRLVKKSSWAFDHQIKEYTLIGLSDISDFTRTNIYDIDVFAKELEIRKSAAYLAYTLFEHYTRQGESVPDVLHVWKEICISENEFSEIRNQWVLKSFD